MSSATIVYYSWQDLPNIDNARYGDICLVKPYYIPNTVYAVWFNGKHWDIFGFLCAIQQK